MVLIFWAWDLLPGTASPWVNRAGQLMIPVSREVAPLVGIDAGITGEGRTQRRCKLANVPEILRRHVELAVSLGITNPDAHPLRNTRVSGGVA